MHIHFAVRFSRFAVTPFVSPLAGMPAGATTADSCKATIMDANAAVKTVCVQQGPNSLVTL